MSARRDEAIAHLRAAVEIMKTDPFVEKYIRPDNEKEREREGLGILISVMSEWSGPEIMRVFYAALEDANYHRESAVVSNWIKALEAPQGGGHGA